MAKAGTNHQLLKRHGVSHEIEKYSHISVKLLHRLFAAFCINVYEMLQYDNATLHRHLNRINI